MKSHVFFLVKKFKMSFASALNLEVSTSTYTDATPCEDVLQPVLITRWTWKCGKVKLAGQKRRKEKKQKSFVQSCW